MNKLQLRLAIVARDECDVFVDSSDSGRADTWAGWVAYQKKEGRQMPAKGEEGWPCTTTSSGGLGPDGERITRHWAASIGNDYMIATSYSEKHSSTTIPAISDDYQPKWADSIHAAFS